MVHVCLLFRGRKPSKKTKKKYLIFNIKKVNRSNFILRKAKMLDLKQELKQSWKIEKKKTIKKKRRKYPIVPYAENQTNYIYIYI